MTIMEFIETQYPIKDKVRTRLENPYKRVEAMDDLPYDKIGPDEYGHITKLVEVDEDRYISVIELIGMTKEEVASSEDVALQNVWDAYMSQIDLQDLNIVDIMECVKQHNTIMQTRKEQLGVLSV